MKKKRAQAQVSLQGILDIFLAPGRRASTSAKRIRRYFSPIFSQQQYLGSQWKTSATYCQRISACSR